MSKRDRLIASEFRMCKSLASAVPLVLAGLAQVEVTRLINTYPFDCLITNRYHGFGGGGGGGVQCESKVTAKDSNVYCIYIGLNSNERY